MVSEENEYCACFVIGFSTFCGKIRNGEFIADISVLDNVEEVLYDQNRYVVFCRGDSSAAEKIFRFKEEEPGT